MGLNTSEKIRIAVTRSGKTMYAVAKDTCQIRQNFSNKLKHGDFKESELRAIAEAVGAN